MRAPTESGESGVAKRDRERVKIEQGDQPTCGGVQGPDTLPMNTTSNQNSAGETLPVYAMARQLASLLTQHDAKQANSRHYNRNALPLYLQAVHSWEEDKDTASNPIGTLSKYFTANPANDRDFCLAPVRKFVKSISL